MNIKPIPAINTLSPSNEIQDGFKSRHLPIDSFESSDLMQMRS